jgi:hypothetical protein
MKVNYKTIKNEKYSLEIPENSDVQTLRQAIAVDRSIPNKTELIRIIFNGKALVDGKLLSDYKIHDDSTVIIIINTKTIPVPTPTLTSTTLTSTTTTTPEQPINQSGPPLPIIPSMGSIFNEPSANSEGQPNIGNLFMSSTVRSQSGLNIGNLFGGERQPDTGLDTESTINGLDIGSIINGSDGGNLLSLVFLGAMMNDPEMRQMVESNPGLALQIVSNPNFIRQVFHSSEESPVLTEDEQAEVQELIEMGIPESDARECYIVAEKDKMLAANIFFSRN